MELTQRYTKGNRDVDNNWYRKSTLIFDRWLIALQVPSYNTAQGALIS